MPETSVLLIDPDPKSATYIQKALADAGYRVRHTPSGKKGLIHAWRDRPDVIILELDLPDIDGLEVVRKLRSDDRTAHKQLYALTSPERAEQASAERETGIDDYILKQAGAVDVLLQILSGGRQPMGGELAPSEPSQAGRLLMFLSANGGAGISSLCLNLAHEIAQLRPERTVAVVDLVLPNGALAKIVGAEDGKDLTELNQVSPQNITSDFLRKNLPYTDFWGFWLVRGTSDSRGGSDFEADRVTQIFGVLGNAFDYVFVDIGHNLRRFSTPLLTLANALVVVLASETTAVANTHALLKYLEAEEIPPERVFVVSSRPLSTQGLKSRELEEGLGRQVDAGLPHCGAHLRLANSLHRPLSSRFPGEALATALHDIALQLISKAMSAR